MPFTIVRNDITRMAVDAIVNSAAPHLLGGGGADGAIHRAAGPELREACRALEGCKPGEAKLTKGYRLPCRYVIHTVGPVWMGGNRGEEEKLRACYRNALQLAVQTGMESVAFPLISSGSFGFPKELALQVATEELRAFVLSHDMMVYLVVYDPASFRLSTGLQQRIRQYIDEHYIAGQECIRHEPWFHQSIGPAIPAEQVLPDDGLCNCAPADEERWPAEATRAEIASKLKPDLCAAIPDAAPRSAETLEDRLRSLLRRTDESFTDRLLRKIDESGMTDPECYRRANIDRRLFSKIRNNRHYQPTKPTALAFAIALGLSRPETDELLRAAGLALSSSSHFDLVVAFFIEEGIYDVMQINQALYDFDLPLLGNQ